MAVIIEGGYMAKLMRPIKLETQTGIRHFAMICSTGVNLEQPVDKSYHRVDTRVYTLRYFTCA